MWTAQCERQSPKALDSRFVVYGLTRVALCVSRDANCSQLRPLEGLIAPGDPSAEVVTSNLGPHGDGERMALGREPSLRAARTIAQRVDWKCAPWSGGPCCACALCSRRAAPRDSSAAGARARRKRSSLSHDSALVCMRNPATGKSHDANYNFIRRLSSRLVVKLASHH